MNTTHARTRCKLERRKGTGATVDQRISRAGAEKRKGEICKSNKKQLKERNRKQKRNNCINTNYCKPRMNIIDTFVRR